MVILHYLFAGVVWVLSLLPLRMLYGFSDFLYLLIYHIIGYRKQVVFTNLRNSFPEKDEKAIRKTGKQYFHNMADIITEVIKIRHIRKEELLKRVTFENLEYLNKLYDQNRSVIAATGHSGNWEWVAMTLAMNTRHTTYAVVKLLSDPFFEKYLSGLRTKFNKDSLIKFHEATRAIIRNKNKLSCYVFVADQTPHRSEIKYRTQFLNQDTPVFLGTEKVAKALDYPVVFLDVKRKKRGYYHVTIKPLFEKPKETGEYEITEKHVNMLEQSIREQPDNWLWSHRRWKY